MDQNNVHGSPAPQPSAYRSWMGTLTLVVLLAIFIGFWQYSETLIGTLERQAGDLAKLRADNNTLSQVVNIASSERSVWFELKSAIAQTGAVLAWHSGSAAVRIADLPDSGRYFLRPTLQDQMEEREFLITPGDSVLEWKVLEFDSPAASPELISLWKDSLKIGEFHPVSAHRRP